MNYIVIKNFKGLETEVNEGDILEVKDYTDEAGTFPALWKGDKVVCDIESNAEKRYCKILK